MSPTNICIQPYALVNLWSFCITILYHHFDLTAYCLIQQTPLTNKMLNILVHTLWYVLYRSRSFHKSLNQNVYCLLLMDAVVVHWCVNQHYRGHLSTTWQTAKCQPSTGRPQTSSSLPRPYHAQWAMIAILVWFWYFWYWSWHIEMGDFRMKNYHWTLSFQILYLLTLYDLLLYLFF